MRSRLVVVEEEEEDSDDVAARTGELCQRRVTMDSIHHSIIDG